MNSKANPILIEMASQLPESSKIYQLIAAGEDYPAIIGQAQEDFFCLGDMEKEIKNGMTGINMLKKNGYENWLENMEEEDRLRMCGVLQMIAEMSEELNEE